MPPRENDLYQTFTTDNVTVNAGNLTYHTTADTTGTTTIPYTNYVLNDHTTGRWANNIPYDWTPNAVDVRNTTNTVQLTIDMKLDEFQRKLDRYLDRIFRILKEEYNMTISEEDFMRLIKEE